MGVGLSIQRSFVDKIPFLNNRNYIPSNLVQFAWGLEWLGCPFLKLTLGYIMPNFLTHEV